MCSWFSKKVERLQRPHTRDRASQPEDIGYNTIKKGGGGVVVVSSLVGDVKARQQSPKANEPDDLLNCIACHARGQQLADLQI